MHLPATDDYPTYEGVGADPFTSLTVTCSREATVKLGVLLLCKCM